MQITLHDDGACEGAAGVCRPMNAGCCVCLGASSGSAVEALAV